MRRRCRCDGPSLLGRGRGISAEAFSHLVDRSAAGIRTDVLVGELRRGWTADGGDGDELALRRELSSGRPVLTLIEDRPSTFHYVVLVGWHERGSCSTIPRVVPFVVMSAGEFAVDGVQHAGGWRLSCRAEHPASIETVHPPLHPAVVGARKHV